MGTRFFPSAAIAVAALLVLALGASEAAEKKGPNHAYAAMMYMGTPRDYEFYVATRVLMRSLAKLAVEADRVVIASADVPLRWVQTMEEEDGVKVVTVENIKNPYVTQGNFNTRFKLTLNKLYAWSLVSYDRVVMLDADNIFLRNADELFQCGHFCAVFINPCIFHTGLFVLQPSTVVFKDMLHELEIGRANKDGADQGFLVSYFPELLDRPMFHPPENGTKLAGTYRLPLGYQMDASYYCALCSHLSLEIELVFSRFGLICSLSLRFEASMERAVRPQQRDHLPEHAVAEAVVLVVVAGSPSGPAVARAPTEHPRVRLGDAGDADPGGDLPGSHRRHPPGATQPVQALLQPALGEDGPVPARPSEGSRRVVGPDRLRPPLLPGATDGAPGGRMGSVRPRRGGALLGCGRRIPVAGASADDAAGGGAGLPVRDGVPLVRRRGAEGFGLVRVRVLLRTRRVGGGGDHFKVVEWVAGERRLLPEQNRGVHPHDPVQQQALLISSSLLDIYSHRSVTFLHIFVYHSSRVPMIFSSQFLPFTIIFSDAKSFNLLK